MDEQPNKMWYMLGPRLPWWKRGRTARFVYWFRIKVLRRKPYMHDVRMLP